MSSSDMATSPAAGSPPDAPKPRTAIDTYKQSFREYLWRTHAVESEHDLERLMALLHEPLPVSFRLNLHRGEDAQSLMQRLSSELQFPRDTAFYSASKDSATRIAVNPPTPIPWYPLPNVAWQLDCGRVALSKTAPKHEDVKRFHSALLAATDAGIVDRQEAVSMLPVLFLDVQPGHSVLDMCASPGSKTTQALDSLSTGDHGGMVVANDLDKKRAYMLVHRLSRNTLRNAVVTCGSGITFPGLYQDGQLQPTNVFDRVLCDVPCSGDGTLRKSQQLWKDWHIGQGLTLHPTQLALALRGAALLKVGGVMVYSTCSFNPIENEAVVAELLRRCDGALELVDVQTKLPALKYRPGRTQWPVGWRSKSKSTHMGHVFKTAEETTFHDWYDSYAALPQELRGQRILRSMFAPTEGADELKKTLRLVPIDQNSGGFYIAVLRKTRDLPGGVLQPGLAPLEEELELKPPADYVCKLCNQQGHLMKNCTQYVPDDEYESAPKAKKPRVEAEGKKEKKRETPYRPIADDAWELIQSFYGVQDASLRSKLWCRSDSAANVNYVDDDISRACLAGDALEIVNTGLKVFTKVTEKGETFYRPTGEALGFIDAFFTQRVLEFTKGDLELLLGSANAHVPNENLSPLAQTSLEGVVVGPAVARLSEKPSVAVNLWVGTGAVLPRVAKTLKGEIEAALQAV